MKHFKWARFAASAFMLALSLGGCGGGGGGSPESPPTTPTTPPVEDAYDVAAKGANYRVVYVDNPRHIELSWKDVFTDETGYRIEQSSGAGWTTLATVPAVAGSGTTIDWSGAVTEGGSYRVLGLAGGREVPLISTNGATSVSTQAAVAARIELSQADPVQGTLTFSVSGLPQAQYPQFLVDAHSVPAVPGSAPDFKTDWASDEPSVPNGAHQVMANLYIAADLSVKLSRNFQVRNSDWWLDLSGYYTAPRTVLLIKAGKSQRTGASGSSTLSGSVTLVVDGKDFATTNQLTHPECPPYPCEAGYTFEVTRDAVGAGSHIIGARATDSVGLPVYVAHAGRWVLDAAPTITLDSPAKSLLAPADLLIQGRTTDDSGNATLKVTLDAATLLTQGVGDFSLHYDTRGLASGIYGLTFTATDSAPNQAIVNRWLIVDAEAAPMELVLEAPGLRTSPGPNFYPYQFKGASDGGVVVGQSDKLYWFSPDGGTLKAQLAASSNASYSAWLWSGGRWFATGTDPAFGYHVASWDPAGSLQVVGQTVNGTISSSASSDTRVAWRQPYATDDSLWTYDAATRAAAQVVRWSTADTRVGLASQGGVADSPSGPVLVFTQGKFSSNSTNWSESTVYTQLGSGALTKFATVALGDSSSAVTDGQQVAWLDVNAKVWVQPLDRSKPAEQVASNVSGPLRAAQGLIAWTEGGDGQPKSAKVYQNGVVTALGSGADTTVLDVGNGGVAFRRGTSSLWAWTPAKGAHKVLSQTTGASASLGTVRVAGGYVYFVIGSGDEGAVFRSPL